MLLAHFLEANVALWVTIIIVFHITAEAIKTIVCELTFLNVVELVWYLSDTAKSIKNLVVIMLTVLGFESKSEPSLLLMCLYLYVLAFMVFGESYQAIFDRLEYIKLASIRGAFGHQLLGKINVWLVYLKIITFKVMIYFNFLCLELNILDSTDWWL